MLLFFCFCFLLFSFLFYFPNGFPNHGQHMHPNADEVATENGQMVESLCEIVAEALDRLSRLAGTV